MKLLTLVTAVITLTASALTFATQVSQMSQAQLLSMINAPKSEAYVILDVRSAEEFSEGHLPGAINVSHDQIEQHLTDLSQHKDTLVVVHCRSGRRAQVAETALINNGFSKLQHLAGDYKGWVAADLPIVK